MTAPIRLLPLLVLLGVMACGPAATPQGSPSDELKPSYGGQMALRTRADPIDFDPSYQGRNSTWAFAQAYNSLLGFESGPGVSYTDMIVRPELAERWEVSPDARTFTFHLRKGVKYATLAPLNGRDFTAADVKWSVEYWTRMGEFKEKKLPQSRNDFMYAGLESVTASDPHTVQLRFKDPFVPFLAYAASDMNPIVSKEIYDQDGHLQDRIVGMGPFQLDVDASQKGTRWVWKKNPSYWEEGKPYLDEVRWLVLPEGATAYAAFRSKQVHGLGELGYQDFQEASKTNPGAKSFKYLQPNAAYVRLNQVPGRPLTDIRVRQAVSLALDRDEVNKIFTGGEGVWALPGAMAGLYTEAEAKQLQRQDLTEAKRLLAEAGQDGVTLELPVDNARSQSEVTLYQLIQAQLKKAGINVDLKFMDLNTQRQKRLAGEFDLDVSTGLLPLEADSDSTLFSDYHSTSGPGLNYARIRDPQLDRLLEAQRGESDPGNRKELLRATVKRVVDMNWTAALVYAPKWDMIQADVENYYPHFSDRGPHLFSWFRK